MKEISKYLSEVRSLFKTEHAREHAYRPALKTLVEALNPDLKAVNDPKQSEHGAPDFALINKVNLPIGYIEAKDLDASLDKVEKSEQMERYYGYTNLILTNYLEFRFFKNGEKYTEPVEIGKLQKNSISSDEKQFKQLQAELSDFLSSPPEEIKSGKRLAKIMAGKARRIKENIDRFLSTESEKNGELLKVYEAIKKSLVHDLDVDSFADMYAQTLVYGLFVARYNDETPKDFSRIEARDLIPKSNPLLQHFFDHIVGPNFDKRLEYIVNELCEVFSHTDIQELMKEYFKNDLWGKTRKGPDPVIHFYEDFLKEYDEDLRKKMGAYYTPLPVVQFIVRSIDYLLEKEFGFSEGLADTSKDENEVHRVQILDPAAGTGTFISDVIGKIYARIKRKKQEGRWPTYVHNELLPRIHGFELMMAPYTIAHLKLGIAFKKTGFKYFNDRLGIYLTNSLEEGTIQDSFFTGFGFAESIAEESKEASVIKNKKPIMVVLGNPPYSVSSSNRGKWIQDLIKDYKKELGEKKINIDDDYIKFIRLAEYFIEKNRTGLVAMITNNSYIDGITHRQMRKHLLETFDNIYILNLHGNVKKKEKAPDGGKDENIFDIQQGVAISIFVRQTSEKEELGTVHYAELYGKRGEKFNTLNESEIQSIKWSKLHYSDPYYFFVPISTEAESEYKMGFKINELMSEYNSGIQSKRDKICFTFNKDGLEKIVDDFKQENIINIRTKYSLPKDGRDWTIEWAQNDLRNGYTVEPVLYRPFDVRQTAYTGKSKGFLAYPREKTFRHFVDKENIGLITVRQQSTFDFQHVLATKWMIESGAISLQTKEWGYIFPLYLYTEGGSQVPNLKKEVADEIKKIVGKITPEEIFDYIYAVLHSPRYREKYKEFLKIDFPRVPYPKDKKQLDSLVAIGRELREIHLLEPTKVNQFITTYPVSGSNAVDKIDYKDTKVFINSGQYFGDVPEPAWNFYIGGYQPAQKWLKDRKGGVLTNEDIEHYQKIIVALVETDRIMKEIDKIKI